MPSLLKLFCLGGPRCGETITIPAHWGERFCMSRHHTDPMRLLEHRWNIHPEVPKHWYVVDREHGFAFYEGVS